jgi:hypothetical protein
MKYFYVQSEIHGDRSLLRAAALAAVLVGAVGSVAFMLYAGRHNPSRLLMTLFTLWVLSPFVAPCIGERGFQPLDGFHACDAPLRDAGDRAGLVGHLRIHCIGPTSGADSFRLRSGSAGLMADWCNRCLVRLNAVGITAPSRSRLFYQPLSYS